LEAATETTEEFHDCDCALGGGYPACGEFWRLKKSLDNEGAAKHREEAVRAERAARREVTAVDWPTRLERLQVPAQAIVALRDGAGRPAEGAQETVCIAAARKFLAAPPRMLPGLVLVGPTGVGKTVAAAFVVRDFARKWDWNGQPTGPAMPPAIWLPARRLTSLSAFDDADAELFRHALKTRLLVLDDVGDEATDFAKARLTDLLMQRLDDARRTVITSNLTAERFKARYGEALTDRINTRTLHPRLDGKSLRKKAATP
jgi:hypothetical protein